MRKKSWNISYAIEELKVHRDARGVLYEVLRFTSQDIPKGGQIYVYTVSPGTRRGDHFHAHKSEWFVCVAGRVRVLMKTKDGHRINEVLDACAPKMVYAGPETSHAVVNEMQESAVIIAYASKEFDPLDSDTITEQAG